MLASAINKNNWLMGSHSIGWCCRGTPLYKKGTKLHFTFLQAINGGIIVIIYNNLFDIYLVDKRTKRTQIKKHGVVSGVAAPKNKILVS